MIFIGCLNKKCLMSTLIYDYFYKEFLLNKHLLIN